MTSIDVLNLQEDDWKKYVTNILVQMFGDKLKFMSVKGYRGNIALHSKIQRALFNLINDKADPQISLQAFNLAINKACTNRKTSSAKVSIIVNHKKEDDDDKDDDDEDEQNFNRSLTNLKNYDDLPRFVSSSQVLSSAVSRTSSPVMVEEKEKNEEFLEDTYQNDRTNNLPPTDLDSSLHLDRSQATLLDTNNSMFPPSTNETTVEVDIPLRNSSHEQSTITLICSKSIVQHQPAVESTITPIHSNTQSQLNNTPTVSSSNRNSYPQQHSTTMTTTSGTHSNAYVQSQPTNIPATSSSYANPYYRSQSTVTSATAPTYPHNEFQRQITNAPSVSSAYANQYSQLKPIEHYNCQLIFIPSTTVNSCINKQPNLFVFTYSEPIYYYTCRKLTFLLSEPVKRYFINRCDSL
ncbi:eisosome protein SEG2-like isoform X2 [Cotesia glomerata]|uniref:eisosome protein SEG2-like isoform X2 n=1 Tax=Cotesia glomerata TaxID=32391 RepID=UPI001D02B4E7|nr:eisosome protein SEG2-like isoform X2 [Cotesia glomerata]